MEEFRKKRATLRRFKKKRKGFCKQKTEELPVNVAVRDDVTVAEVEEEIIVEEHDTSSSSKKLEGNVNFIGGSSFDFGVESTIFFNTELLTQMLCDVARCPDCNEKLQIEYLSTRKQGLAHFFQLKCGCCKWNKTYCSSQINRGTYEINLASIIAFREMGLGYENMKSFCGMMNMPPPMNLNAFVKASTKLHGVYTDTAHESMKQASLEVKKSCLKQNVDTESEENIVTEETVINAETVVDTLVSFDGTWQKRGYASLNGVVTAMSSQGKCLDVEIMSKKCKACQRWKGKAETPPFIKWKEAHMCKINYEGSAGSMESAGVMAIYHRSISKHGLRYTTYLGDGDTKSFQDVVESNPYPGIVIKKLNVLVMFRSVSVNDYVTSN